ncbi:hypothetical protein TNCV_3708581, partial [Trichonephila clavipes]
TWEVERGQFYDPVRSLCKSKNQEINRLQLAVSCLGQSSLKA